MHREKSKREQIQRFSRVSVNEHLHANSRSQSEGFVEKGFWVVQYGEFVEDLGIVAADLSQMVFHLCDEVLHRWRLLLDLVANARETKVGETIERPSLIQVGELEVHFVLPPGDQLHALPIKLRTIFAILFLERVSRHGFQQQEDVIESEYAVDQGQQRHLHRQVVGVGGVPPVFIVTEPLRDVQPQMHHSDSESDEDDKWGRQAHLAQHIGNVAFALYTAVKFREVERARVQPWVLVDQNHEVQRLTAVEHHQHRDEEHVRLHKQGQESTAHASDRVNVLLRIAAMERLPQRIQENK
mmetsp:Transcript_20186/g.55915  ORF Transcript_20186/g.55915 Transcript_20186/m.55915 type:complete len:298 (+) Transcript_20186:1097-1990(+)